MAGTATIEEAETASTVDQLARRAGTTTRNVRAFQTLGLLHRPTLRGRTGLYDREHLERLEAILRLQRAGFSLAALCVLFGASERGLTLEQVLGLPAAGSRRRSGPDRGGEDRPANDQLGAFDDWPVDPGLSPEAPSRAAAPAAADGRRRRPW